VTATSPSRLRRILGGWSASFLLLLLSLTQQILLIPLFLKYWSSDTLSAWLTIFAAGNLVLAADAGMHGWSLNRFFSFKSRPDCDRRTARYFGAAFQLLVRFTALAAILFLALTALIAPSRALGFATEARFDVAFVAMVLGSIFLLLGNLATALYRARGLYGRVANIQVLGVVAGQIGQIAGLVATGSLLVVVLAYVLAQAAATIYLIAVDVRRQFPFLVGARSRISWRWIVLQFTGAFPFAVMNFAEVGLGYLSVLLVGSLVSDRIAIAQWGLTRTIANLVRGLCFQLSLPLASELGHDHAIGARESLQRLYARGSAVLVLLAGVVTSGLLAFGQDFFAIWTHGAIPYDETLMIFLLLGTCVAVPAILALAYANYSNRGGILVRTKSLQLAMFVILSLVMIPRFGPLGAAIALVLSDLIAQSGFLSFAILGETLKYPVRYTLLLFTMMIAIVSAGTALGKLIAALVPGSGLTHFVVECAVWLSIVAIVSAPLALKDIRNRLINVLPT